MREKLEKENRSSIKHFGLMFLLLLSVVFCSSTVGLAQEKVEGTVLDEIGSPLPGVTVIIKSTTIGTITNFEGYFSLDAKEGDIVSISFIGYKAYDIKVVSGMTKQQIQLEPDFIGLNEVVAIGYGTQRKGDVTSAVASVKDEDFLAGNTQSAADLIKGKIAGLVITKASGDPNAEASINLRGMVSLEGNASPLVLIDGIPGDMGTVSSENIASIDVLKDASAAAIYGTRGASGVILITTKSGRRDEKPTVNYSGYITTSEFYKKADFMDSDDIRAGKTVFKDKGWDTDWVKGISQDAYTQNHSLSVTGGTKNASYSANVSYRQEEGIIQSTGNDELKMSFDVNQYFLNDVLKVNLNLVKGVHKHDISDPSYAYRQAVIRNPSSPVYDTDGSYSEDFSVLQYYNPVAILNEKIGENRSEWTRMTGNITAEPISGWKTNLMVATHRSFSNDKSYTTSKYYTATTNNRQGEAFQSSYNSQTDFIELTSRYDKNMGEHRFSALAGYSYQKSSGESFWASNYGFPTDYYLYNSLGNGTALNKGKAGMGSDKNEHKLIGFFGRVSYGFANKYNILASIRHEGSSKFGDNNKWGTFPSVSLGWTLSNEQFMQTFSWLDNLKLRAGYGVTGVIPNDPYQSLSRYSYSSGNYFDGSEWKKGLGAISNPNPDLKWEKSGEYNVGLDLSVFNDRVSATVDYYDKTTTDMLYWYSVPVPPNLYTSTLANVGKMTNRGIEVMVNLVPVKSKNFEWVSNVTLSHNENKLVSLSNDLYETENYMLTAYASDPISLPTHRVELGRSMGTFWGMKSVGLSENGVWMIENPETGEAVEFNDDVKADEKYRQFLGTGIPKINLGWNNTFRYKDFDLVVQMSGQFGHKILNTQRMFYENNSISYNRLKSAADDVYGVSPLSNSLTQTFVSYYLEKGDYMKMDNLTLGYTFSGIKHVSKLRVYASAENLFCITGYSGLDPELNTDYYSAGTDDRDKYPSIRSFTFGVNVTF